MPTPTEHAAAVDTFLARAANSALTPPLDDEYTAAEVRAALSVATGTGTAYTTADTLLTQAEAKPVGLRRRTLQLARIHALRAAR
ncbi:MAG: hypothetical protein FJW64_05325 [Actinobacteria bacterium]|nr:hypothetical protein [Actinomycetota bacterium]